MISINAIGMTCPQPVIETKKAIAKLPASGGRVEVLVDNLVATENLSKMAKQKGYKCDIEKHSNYEYLVTIFVGNNTDASESKTINTSTEIPPINMQSILNSNHESPNASEGLAVSIGQDRMGNGDESLGKILVKGFIFSLANLEIPPSSVLFYNSGVKLTIEGANTLDDLKTLASKGCKIFVCGTCVDFFGCKEQVRVGEITNMYEIVETLKSANRIINI